MSTGQVNCMWFVMGVGWLPLALGTVFSKRRCGRVLANLTGGGKGKGAYLSILYEYLQFGKTKLVEL